MNRSLPQRPYFHSQFAQSTFNLSFHLDRSLLVSVSLEPYVERCSSTCALVPSLRARSRLRSPLTAAPSRARARAVHAPTSLPVLRSCRLAVQCPLAPMNSPSFHYNSSEARPDTSGFLVLMYLFLQHREN